MDEQRLQQMYDWSLISQTISRFFFALDRKDWTSLRAVIDDEFDLDASKLTGQPSEAKPAAQFIEETARRNGGFAGTLHLNPNHVVTVDGDTAAAQAYMYAPHWVGQEVADYYMSAGTYDIDLVRRGDEWRMTRLALTIWREEGDAGRVYAGAARTIRRLVRLSRGSRTRSPSAELIARTRRRRRRPGPGGCAGSPDRWLASLRSRTSCCSMRTPRRRYRRPRLPQQPWPMP
jgi:hypothetical protein